MSDINAALEVLRNIASPDVVKAAETLVLNGQATWVTDPIVPGVVGLSTDDAAIIIVYVNDDDFEMDEEALFSL